MLYIGVDLGTSAVKLLLMDENGNIHKIVSREYPLYFPHPGWSEQKPGDWFAQSMEGIRELTTECDKSQVRGISFGGQMHGLVVLDEADHVIRPAILWNDGRTEKETEYLNQVIGKETLSKYTANIAFAGFTAPKILWMKEHEPELFEKIAKIMLPKDYLAYNKSHCRRRRQCGGGSGNRNRRRRSVQYFPWNFRHNLYIKQDVRCGSVQCAAFICTCRRQLSSDGMYAKCGILQ